ncbi:MAG: four-helix bundle copper-binding protein [Ferruginibacter sp.]
MTTKFYQSQIDELNNCAGICNYCIAACFQEDDVKMLTDCIQLDIDCAEMCSLTAGLLARGSKYAEPLLQVCADICNACAEECGKHTHMDHCKACAEACKKCAAACEQMQSV